MSANITIKQILLSHQNWWRFYSQYKDRIRPDILICITKLLSCKNTVRGFTEYTCTNPACTHIKRVAFTCKCKACSSCGKKATALWLEKQIQLLPKTTWQHITFTMPSELWDFFWYNRFLLNHVAKIAANCIKTIAKKKNLIPGIFIAIHTFGRDMKRNVHIHLSTTTGGLSLDLKTWKFCFFHQATLMRMWRYNIIKLFRKKSSKLSIPSAIKSQLNHIYTFNRFLDSLYKKTWIVHCSKPVKNHQSIVTYLSRYLKRPPIAESRLKHYNGNEISFKYLDHKSKSYRHFNLSVQQFIRRFIQHIPDIGFRMIRYYGFLANRVRTKLLPIAYSLIHQMIPNTSRPLTYSELINKCFGFDPLTCILCGYPLQLTYVQFGKYNSKQMLRFHRELALMKIC